MCVNIGVVIVLILTIAFINLNRIENSEDEFWKHERNDIEVTAKGERYPYEAENWCLNDDVNEHAKQKCKNDCNNPLAPKVQLHYFLEWTQAHNLYTKTAENAPNNTEVVFLGDSILEGFTGRKWGLLDDKYKGCNDVFNSLFSSNDNDNANYQGTVLAIAGDQTNHLLWRLQNGELPSNLNPKVFWLLIGTNNFGDIMCSDEVVVRGIIRVVEEIREMRPDSKIVINGLLPRADRTESGKLELQHSRTDKDLKNIWNGIELVNKKLSYYAEEHDEVYYVDSKSIFLRDSEEGEIDKELMFDFLHPTMEGYQLWGDSIIEKLQEIIPKDEE